MTDEIKKKDQIANEIGDNELEDVSGGGWFRADPDYSSGDTPEFAVGDECMMRAGSLRRVTIVKVNYSKSGISKKEFTYTVKYAGSDKTESGVYESQLRRIMTIM